MSACGVGTVTEEVLESFSLSGSKVCDDAVAMFVNVVPGGVAGGMLATMVKFALDPAVNAGIEQLTVPLVPTDGVEQLKTGPLFCVSETNVMPAGSGSFNVAASASSGPKLLIVTS